VTGTRIDVTREQILAFRRRTGSLDERLPSGADSLRRAAWAGLQDSMPRAALLSIHARVQGTEPSAWEDPSLIQLWGPRYHTYVAPARDLALFSLARLPDDGGTRQVAGDLAARLHALLGGPVSEGGTTMVDREAGRALGENPNRFRYAALTGTVVIRWDGARPPVIWIVPRPDVDARIARLELARRYLRVFGPATPESFARWAGIATRAGAAAFAALGTEVAPVYTPIGGAWILTADEPTLRAAAVAGSVAPARLLPSGDAYLLGLREDERELLVPDPAHRRELWPSRVWPGGLLIDGEVVGSWRRAEATLTIHLWQRLSPAARQAVEAEAHSLPIPGVQGRLAVHWDR
jgi:hypothetical protein